MNAGEAARHDLVQGMISIRGISALLLFDSGSTHSFMSYSLMCKLNLKTRMLEPPLIVNLPSGEKILADKQVGPVVMHVQGKCMAWDFVLYHLVGIDLILGMDWLEKNQAIIDCEKKEIHLNLEGDNRGKRIFFRGEEQLGHHPGLISFVKAAKYLRQGCPGYLASLVGGIEGEKVDVNLVSVRVVNEYLDVFSNELPGLPPMRDSEFFIDLLLAMAPISKAPYRIASAELQ